MALIVHDEETEGEDLLPDFDEEAIDRDEIHIARMVDEFHDEDPIVHDELPESDSDDDFQVPDSERVNIRRGDGRLYQDQTFVSAVAFKESVLDYALRTGRNIKQYRYDKEKIGYKCVGSGECEWQVYCSVHSNSDIWKIRVFNDKHICVPNGECEMFKVPVIARLFVDKIREEPDYFLPMKIEETIKERWKILVTRGQCQAARKKAMKWIENEYNIQFSRLRDYAAEIKQSNFGSSVEIDTYRNEEGEDVFSRFYVCFDALKRTWKDTCRPLIGVDGCHLRGKMKGQFLVALGRDANNAIYPIAWGVVQVENKDNWLWFVRLLKKDLDLLDGDRYIMISDRQKGLIASVELELPKIEHRMCVRHIYGNLKKKHGSKKQMKPLIWRLAWSYNEADYNDMLDRILNYDSGVHADIMNSNPRKWCRAFNKLGNFCEDVENNFTESFNSSIVRAREKAFVPMLETVRRLAMARIAKRDCIANAHKGLCTPYVQSFLACELRIASQCKITRSTNGDYEAHVSGCSYRINMDRRTCSCRKWEISGIPCEHAYGVILFKKLQPEDFVCHWFRTHMWRRNYAEGIVPLRGRKFWPTTDAPDVQQPPPPPQPGRKKISKKDRKRKKGMNESPTRVQPKQLKRVMHCGICGAANHNSRFHKKDVGQTPLVTPAATATQAESSQGTLTHTSEALV